VVVPWNGFISFQNPPVTIPYTVDSVASPKPLRIRESTSSDLWTSQIEISLRNILITYSVRWTSEHYFFRTRWVKATYAKPIFPRSIFSCTHKFHTIVNMHPPIRQQNVLFVDMENRVYSTCKLFPRRRCLTYIFSALFSLNTIITRFPKSELPYNYAIARIKNVFALPSYVLPWGNIFHECSHVFSAAEATRWGDHRKFGIVKAGPVETESSGNSLLA